MKLRCRTHGREQEAYAVCRHIVEKDAAVVVHNPPNLKLPQDNIDRMGELVCAIPGKDHKAEDLVLMCESCAKQWVPS